MKISVALCTYNGAAFLEEQICSLFAQQRRPSEIILCDDCSSDATATIAAAMAVHAPVVLRVHVNHKRLGSTKNFEKAISLCSGDLIALCDQDDVWLPSKLAVADARFSADPELSALFSDAELVDSQLRVMGLSLWEAIEFTASDQAAVELGDDLSVFLDKSFVMGSTLIFRSRLRELVLPIPGGLRNFIHDRWIGVMAAATSKIRFIPERLVRYRQHGAQQLGAIADPGLRQRMRSALGQNRDVYAAELQGLRAVASRLADRAAGAVAVDFARELAERIAFLEARACMPKSRVGRIPVVAAQWRAGRYQRLAEGALSAFKDLIR